MAIQAPSAGRYLLGLAIIFCGVILPFILSAVRKKQNSGGRRYMNAGIDV